MPSISGGGGGGLDGDMGVDTSNLPPSGGADRVEVYGRMPSVDVSSFNFGYTPPSFSGGIADYANFNPQGIDFRFRKKAEEETAETEEVVEQEETAQEETQQPAQTGPMGGKAVPFIKKFIKKLLEIHPATATPMLLMQIGKGLFNSKNVAGDMKKVITQFGMNKLMGNVGISSLGRQALGSLQNVNKGRQTGGQAIGSLMTNAAFRKGFPSLAKQAYQKGGKPAVYGLMSLASMGMENLNKNYFRTPPSGPPGDG